METRLPALYTYGVKTGRITLPRMVELLCTNPARVFGMYPRKGDVAPGGDADLVIFDPGVETSISAGVLHSPVDWSPFGGEILCGFARQVYRRGALVVDGETFLASPGSGVYVARSAQGIDVFS